MTGLNSKQNDAILRHVLSQVTEAEATLRVYPPDAIDWVSRAHAAVQILIPWLCDKAPDLCEYLTEILNSPQNIRKTWAGIRDKYDIDEADSSLLDSQLRREDILHHFTSGDVISKLIEHFLIEHFPKQAMASNGASDYPDLYITSNDYSGLPKFSRSVSKFGATRKGPDARPVRIPDGLEIKTDNNRSINIDCHYPHTGTHLIVHHGRDVETRRFYIRDVLVAFLRPDNYRSGERKTEATTVKHSFNGKSFISILPKPLNSHKAGR